MLLFF